MDAMKEYGTPATYACHHNRDRVRVIAWSHTHTDRFKNPLPFVVDCWDDKHGSYFYEAYGGPNNNGDKDFSTEWHSHWKWRLFDPS
jgi:hypothetical protein